MNRKFKVYFDDTDAAGIMFFGNIYSEAHKAIEDFISVDLGIFEHWFNSRDYVVPIRHSECEHLSPFLLGQEYSSEVTIDKVGNSSIVFKVIFFDNKQKACASIKTVHVFVDPKNKSKITVPKTILDALKKN